MFAFPSPLLEVPGMYDTEPLKKRKIQGALPLRHPSKCGSKRKWKKELAKDEKMWSRACKDSGTVTSHTLQQTTKNKAMRAQPSQKDKAGSTLVKISMKL